MAPVPARQTDAGVDLIETAGGSVMRTIVLRLIGTAVLVILLLRSC